MKTETTNPNRVTISNKIKISNSIQSHPETEFSVKKTYAFYDDICFCLLTLVLQTFQVIA